MAVWKNEILEWQYFALKEEVVSMSIEVSELYQSLLNIGSTFLLYTFRSLNIFGARKNANL